MKRQIYGLLGVVAIAALGAACKDDPLSDTGGSLSRLDLESTYREVIIGDSIRTFAIERDALNTPLPPTATVRSCNTAVATVATVSDAPQVRAGFFVKALTYGTTCVIAEAGALADTMQVATFPASLAILGPDSVGSGSVTQFTWAFRDRAGNTVAGVPAPTFSSSDTLRAKAAVAPVGSVSALAPGLALITAVGVGSPAAGLTGVKGVTVVPGTFTGGITPASGSPGESVKLTNAVGGPGFDSDTRVFINNVETFKFNTTTDSVRFVVPGVGVAGNVTLGLTAMGTAQVAQNGTFTSNSALFADTYDAVNDNPATSPVITTNGDYYIVMHGTCTDGAPTDPGDDCDDFFTITNAGGVPDTMTVRLDWFDAADVDILWRNSGNTAFVGNFAGATGANPEASTVNVPAGATWRLWINLFAPGGASTVVRVRVTNKN